MIDGVPVTEDMIEAWAVEAEQGYDVNQLRRRGRRAMGSAPARVVPVRIDPALLKTVDERRRQHKPLRGHPRRDPRLRRMKVHRSALKHGVTEEGHPSCSPALCLHRRTR